MEKNEKIKKMSEAKATAVKAAIRWAKLGVGELNLRNAIEEYMNISGANRSCSGDKTAIVFGRKSVACDIDIACINELDIVQEEKLHDFLLRIAEDCPSVDVSRRIGR